MKDVLLALFSVIVYRLYWANLSAETRFIRRNKLDAKYP